MIGDGKETCGRWSESRARFGLDRRSEPLVPFILDRQREVGWKNLPVLYACKISRLLGFRDWFASWLEGSQRYRQDRILADSMGWMCRRWMRRRNKVMLTELTRCDSPMRRVPGCLSKPLIGSGHVANHDCVVSCRVDDGASACQVASIWFVRAWRFSCSGRGVDRFARRILRGASALRLSCLGASPVFMTLIGKVTDSGFLPNGWPASCAGCGVNSRTTRSWSVFPSLDAHSHSHCPHIVPGRPRAHAARHLGYRSARPGR